MKLKVCGMKYPENIQLVAELKPDYMGFIFYNKSPRHFSGPIPNLPKSVKKVGVFVNHSETEIITTVKKYNLDVIQLHGNQSVGFITKIHKLLTHSNSIEIWMVFSIDTDFNFSILEAYEPLIDKFLFDTKGKLKGGNGYSFNWNMLNEYSSTKPFILSGGIGIDATEKLKEFKKTRIFKYCYALDVNSRFEQEPGLKNITLLKQFQNRPQQ
ncbi:phosphoribosylanthranilate isomerase [Bizionia sp. KMM 8389]